jgi:hypothetical protein
MTRRGLCWKADVAVTVTLSLSHLGWLVAHDRNLPRVVLRVTSFRQLLQHHRHLFCLLWEGGGSYGGEGVMHSPCLLGAEHPSVLQPALPHENRGYRQAVSPGADSHLMAVGRTQGVQLDGVLSNLQVSGFRVRV